MGVHKVGLDNNSQGSGPNQGNYGKPAVYELLGGVPNIHSLHSLHNGASFYQGWT